MAIEADPTNAAQAEYWNSAGGKRWTEHQTALDRALEPFGAALLERAAAQPGERVLDVGCGCGATSLALAARVGTRGDVLGVDLSVEMLARARQRAAGVAQLRFVAADAARLTGEAPFDLLTSRFGVMFFGDPAAAFSHLRGTLRPGGRVAFVCWRAYEENPWGQVPSTAVQRIVPDAPPIDGDGPGPCAFANPDRVRGVLGAAGFEQVELDPYDADVVFSPTGSLEEAVGFALYSGPAARLLVGASAEAIERARQALTEALAPYRTARGVALGGASWLVTARAP